MIDYVIYIISSGSAIILGLLLKLPLLPEEPKRQSWTISAIFPTAVLALGFTAMISKLGYMTSSNWDYIIALVVGVLTAIFSKYLLERILPRPIKEESSQENSESKEDDKASQSQEESHE